MEVVVDGVASSAALTEDLPVFEAGEDVFDAGADAPVSAVVLVTDDAAGVVAAGPGDGGDAAISAVAEDDSVAAEYGVRGCGGPR